MDTTTAPTHPPATDHVDPELHRLLDAELAYDPVARHGYINHLAMSLVAARRLGATDVELRGLFQDQTSGDFLIPRETPAWLAAETGHVQATGIEPSVRERLPDLAGTPFSQFFHAVIRLELAVDAAHPAQVANALHNWATHDAPLGGAPDGNGVERFTDLLARLFEHRDRRAGGMRDLVEVARQGWLLDGLGSLRADEHLLDDLATAVAAAHATGANFGTLHLVTGTRAVRAVADLATREDARTLSLHAAHAVAAGCATMAEPPHPGQLDDLRGHARASWEEIGRAAIATGDPHVIKLAYACRLEEEAGGDPLHRALAAREAGLG